MIVLLEQAARESAVALASAAVCSWVVLFWLQAICNTTKAKMPAIMIDFFIMMLK
jgi:hypothetical protein